MEYLAYFLYFIDLSLVAIIIKSSFEKTLNPEAIFFFIAFIILNKLPIIFYNQFINSDEAFVFSTALSAFKTDQLLWKNYDFGSVGILHGLLFLIPTSLGFEANYINIRVIFLLIILVIFLFSFFNFQNLKSKNNNCTSFLIIFFIYFFGFISGFNHFSNEVSSILILIIAQTFLFYEFKSVKYSFYFDLLSAFLLGLLPFLKHQSVLIGIFIGLAIILKRKYYLNISKLGLILMVSFLPFLFNLIFVLINNQFENFIFYYFEIPLAFQSNGNIFIKIFHSFFTNNLNRLPVKQLFILSFLIYILKFLLEKEFKVFKYNYTFLLTLVVIYCISKSGFGYDHYYWYLLLPSILMLNYFDEKFIKNQYIYQCIKIGIIFSVIFSNFYLYSKQDFFNFERLNSSNRLPKSLLSKEILKLNNGAINNTMAVFDWKPYLHLETGLLQATHHNIPESMFFSNIASNNVKKIKEKMILKYLEDIKINKPYIFIVQSEKTQSRFKYNLIEMKKNTPQIHEYLLANYKFQKEIENELIYTRIR